MAREDEIRVIAYSIWEEEGCPDGRDCEHWYRAEIVWENQQKEKAAPAASAKRAAALKTATKPAARSSAKKTAAPAK